ncbi:MAG: histidinol-phosphate transaminase [Acidobacteria bacterium RIFCSPLOWO2_12_FULL_54_10]|nr:MAG: histidinol-phosphate transaminase [Acidobacteria bacterium RIFCSPLOWO2_12_FULL_54_10]
MGAAMSDRKKTINPRESILRMDPYRPPSSGRGGKLRLDFNENTIGCSPKAIRSLKKIAPADLAVYPGYEQALPQFAKYFGVAANEITLTNGTDEAIQLVINTYVDAGENVVVLRPAYAMYRFYAQVAGAKIHEVDYSPDLSFPEKDLLTTLDSRTKAVLIANPNNPTGTLASLKQISNVLQAAPNAAVLIDEAYFEFCGQTALPWIKRFPNLFVSRTFSKAFGLAAVRLGCLFSCSGNIASIRKGQSPYSVNAVAVTLGLEAMRDSKYVRQYASQVLQSREYFCKELDRLGLRHFPSRANFVLIDFGDQSRKVRDALEQKDILVRDRSYELPGCVRFTLGTLPQTRRLLPVLKDVMQKLKIPSQPTTMKPIKSAARKTARTK